MSDWKSHLRALDTEAKREVFKEIATQWCPTSYIASTEKLNIPLLRLRALLKRSARLDLRGHVVVRTEAEASHAAPPLR